LLAVKTVEDGLGILLSFFQVLYPVVLFPKHILYLLGFVEAGVDAYVGVVIDVAADLVVYFLVAGGVFGQAVEGHIFFQVDGVQVEDLFLGEVDPFLQGFQLVDGALGGRRFRHLC